jgi:hypothetical protein
MIIITEKFDIKIVKIRIRKWIIVMFMQNIDFNEGPVSLDHVLIFQT